MNMRKILYVAALICSLAACTKTSLQDQHRQNLEMALMMHNQADADKYFDLYAKELTRESFAFEEKLQFCNSPKEFDEIARDLDDWAYVSDSLFMLYWEKYVAEFGDQLVPSEFNQKGMFDFQTTIANTGQKMFSTAKRLGIFLEGGNEPAFQIIEQH